MGWHSVLLFHELIRLHIWPQSRQIPLPHPTPEMQPEVSDHASMIFWWQRAVWLADRRIDGYGFLLARCNTALGSWCQPLKRNDQRIAPETVIVYIHWESTTAKIKVPDLPCPVLEPCGFRFCLKGCRVPAVMCLSAAGTHYVTMICGVKHQHAIFD